MPSYSDDLISEICSKTDIVDYVSMYVQLKRTGRNYKGLCPFHNEKTPSFSVSQDKQLFHCFGCGASGNLIQFVQRSENLDFMDALRLLAERAGMTLPENSSLGNNANHEKRQRYYEMNKLAARFFHSQLIKSPTAELARSYVKDRGLEAKTLTTYGIGFAPEGYDNLLKHLAEAGYTQAEIVDNSLAVQRDGKIYDKFRERLMFPIIDVRGNVIGFGGRIIKEYTGDFKPPKYLNSNETLIFDKGRNLFSLNLAKNAQTDQIILCEGYMDVISVFQAGVKNVVATLGTAITPDQAKLLMRYGKEILICYDMDVAGREAVLRAISIINGVGGKSRVMKLQNAKDPDEYIKKYGVGAFIKAMRAAVPSTEYKLSLVRVEHNLADTESKIAYVNDAVKTLEGVSNMAEVDAYIGKISEDTGISKDAIYAEYNKNVKRIHTTQQSHTLRVVKTTASSNTNQKVNTVQYEAQKRLLTLMLRDKKLALKVEKEFGTDVYQDEVFAKLALAIINVWKTDNSPPPDAAMIVNMFADDVNAQNEASSVFYSNEVYDDVSIAGDELIKSIKLNLIQSEIEACKDPAKIAELLKRLTNIKNNVTEDE